jgi:hypothetical protein
MARSLDMSTLTGIIGDRPLSAQQKVRDGWEEIQAMRPARTATPWAEDGDAMGHFFAAKPPDDVWSLDPQLLGRGLGPMRAVAAVTLLGIGLSTAQAAEPETLTLACTGTETARQPRPVSTGIIVNFTRRTIQGLGLWGAGVDDVKITAMNDVTVEFLGSKPMRGNELDWTIRGRIDRVTGDVLALKIRQPNDLTTYELKCRPAQRLF